MKYLSVTQYAKNKGVTRQSVLAKIKRGTLKAQKIGNTYAIPVTKPR